MECISILKRGLGDAMNIPTEAQEQQAVIRWRDLMVSTGQEPRLALLHGDASGVRVSIGTALKVKKAGAVKGWPDLTLAVPVYSDMLGYSGYHGLFIELKRIKNSAVSPEQRRLHELLRDQGYSVHVCKGADAAIRVIKAYLGGI
jgi:hypothetical protein